MGLGDIAGLTKALLEAVTVVRELIVEIRGLREDLAQTE